MSSLHHLLVVCVIALLLGASYGADDEHKINPLQPVIARDISEVKEPSGITFCESTGHLYVISDQSSHHFIYELDLNAQLVGAHDFYERYWDIEAVSCDTVHSWIYIAEESTHRITSFVLPPASTFTNLTQMASFAIDTGYQEGSSGIEGVTIDTTRNLIYAVNEKHPRMFFNLTVDGEVENIYLPDYAGDLSDLCYDSVLDKIWILSDISERVYLTDLSGTFVYDYWDLALTNGEGITVDNTANPPLLYIVTDPSGRSGSDKFIPALFGFIKPTEGTGLRYFNDTTTLPPQVPVLCDNCTQVFSEIESLQESIEHKEHVHEFLNVLYTAMILTGVVLTVLIIVAAAVLIRRKMIQRRMYRITALFNTELEDDDNL